MRLGNGLTRIQQIVPLPSTKELDLIAAGGDPVKPGLTKVEWPLICPVGERTIAGDYSLRELEPGEVEELYVEFVTNNDKKVLLAYTYINNPKKKDLGWHRSTLYEVLEVTSN